MKKVAKAAGAVITSLGIVVGLSGFAGATSGTIGVTGPFSTNTFRSWLSNSAYLNNNNNIDVNTNNNQRATTGDADVRWNNQGGDAVTGSALNSNSTNVSGSVQNGFGGGFDGFGWGGGVGGGDVVIDTTGPSSYNSVSLNQQNRLNVNNNNNIDVNTNNNQYARSGDANVSFNTFGGSAITGDAQNVNETSVNFDVSN